MSRRRVEHESMTRAQCACKRALEGSREVVIHPSDRERAARMGNLKGPPSERSKKLEAPPGFEPGVEVLQTSALPLGDGAPKKRALLRSAAIVRELRRALRLAASGVHLRSSGATVDNLRTGLPTEAHARVRKRERRLERETGFEPATSTLARSHS